MFGLTRPGIKPESTVSVADALSTRPLIHNIETVLFELAHKSKSNLSLYSLYYAEACNELARPIFASLRLGNTAFFEEMSQRWRAIGVTASDLTGPRFELHTSLSRDERVTARPTGLLN